VFESCERGRETGFIEGGEPPDQLSDYQFQTDCAVCSKIKAKFDSHIKQLVNGFDLKEP
jgi:hypothetical protein